MSYGQSNNHSIENGKKFCDNNIIVDLRSDTLTKPCQKMRQAMFEAVVGDDVNGEDPTVNQLEAFAAELLGKEAALFITSGTMGNLLSIMVHCNQRGSEIYVGDESHIVIHEQGGASQVAGVTICTVPNNEDGTFNLEKLERKIRSLGDIHSPISKMIAVENTMNGNALPMDWINKVVKVGEKYDLKLHMDGARLFNASLALNVPVAEIVKGFDSVTFCLSKGLGAPVGSVLCGTKEFISQARRARKVLGGGMRQSGVLAAAGLVALKHRFKLEKDHEKAAAIMETINSMGSKVFSVNLKTKFTNMVIIHVRSSPNLNATIFAERLGKIIDDNDDDQIIVKAWSISPEHARLVFHLDITDEMFKAAQKKIEYVIKKLDSAL